ncbi:hypothetical protein KKC_01112 [Listeria fleischmannii subsp. coloradonensis]|nr:hypothetical protein KKC_01112 [Listeria fleischmannii subsp. coloradonensis]
MLKLLRGTRLFFSMHQYFSLPIFIWASFFVYGDLPRGGKND